jgi:large subunit ribosomal protein L16
MPLMPQRVKYRKSQRGSRKGTASRNLRIDFGEFGLQTLERAWITNTQIEAARVALTRNMKRKGKLWIRIFPDKSVTARPPETRMGKGKGQPEYWVATVRPAISCLKSMACRNRSRASLFAWRRTSSQCGQNSSAAIGSRPND